MNLCDTQAALLGQLNWQDFGINFNGVGVQDGPPIDVFGP
jgi:hypothetical protein